MASWMKERDRLVEQTMAFVQGVAAQRPIKIDVAEVEPPAPQVLTAEKPYTDKSNTDKSNTDKSNTEKSQTDKSIAGLPGFVSPADHASMVEAEALMSLIAMSLPSLRSDPMAEPISVAEQIIVAEQSQPLRAVATAPVYVPVPQRPLQLALPEREMIAQRVASFRAGQQKLIREREDNYATVQAKIRATLGTDPQA